VPKGEKYQPFQQKSDRISESFKVSINGDLFHEAVIHSWSHRISCRNWWRDWWVERVAPRFSCCTVQTVWVSHAEWGRFSRLLSTDRIGRNLMIKLPLIWAVRHSREGCFLLPQTIAATSASPPLYLSKLRSGKQVNWLSRHLKIGCW